MSDEEEDPSAWRLFHENAKLERFTPRPDDATVTARMSAERPGLRFSACPQLDLPPATALPAALQAVVARRRTARAFGSEALDLADLAALLSASAAVTLPAQRRPLRAIPSAGALFPLELFIALPASETAPARLLHFDPIDSRLAVLKAGDAAKGLATCFVDPTLITQARAVFLIAGIFERSTFKYGERGYRFVLLEAGHLAQALIIAAEALGLAAAPLGGFFDRDLDDWLGLDGLQAGAVYAVAVGRGSTCGG
ncbi:SagB/ThcOx family dehydrogenase [Sphingomonas sp. 7/4-4]|uniref:SagB/ThcOx family dehydrogenase n=1 Tax=Sphingomonas sp. 7/4-4 TaxID=3018446 RepID=UPI0022F3C83F|nr:SagB/ThcOx family dehydrogenase [Sphingomonas sp. 7/4-4]WBY06413.1 SagB/ThcOx family dehydrogenase [Sphingomonas sp. 7/4-4]